MDNDIFREPKPASEVALVELREERRSFFGCCFLLLAVLKPSVIGKDGWPKTYRITYKKNSRKREYACPPNQTHRTINHGCKTSGKDEHIRSPGTCVITRTLNLCFTYFPIVLFLENFVSFLNLDLCLLQQQLHCFTKRDIAGEGVEEVSKVARDCLMVK